MDINDLPDGIMKSINQFAFDAAEQRLQEKIYETGRGPDNRGGGRDEIVCYQKCFEAKALPEPDFRYLSKAMALLSSANAKVRTSRQGRYFAVWIDWPALCATSRFSTSLVRPV